MEFFRLLFSSGNRTRLSSCYGAAIFEFVIAVPIVVILLVGTVTGAQIIWVKAVIQEAASGGARAITVLPLTEKTQSIDYGIDGNLHNTVNNLQEFADQAIYFAYEHVRQNGLNPEDFRYAVWPVFSGWGGALADPPRARVSVQYIGSSFFGLEFCTFSDVILNHYEDIHGNNRAAFLQGQSGYAGGRTYNHDPPSPIEVLIPFYVTPQIPNPKYLCGNGYT